MHRIDGAGHVDHLFVAEDHAALRPPTEITPEIMNAFQEELATLIEWAGIVLAKGNNTQLRQALVAKFAGLDVAATKAGVQGQTYTAFTTAGATGAFTLAPVPAIAAYSAGQRFRVKFHAAGNGSNKLNVCALGDKNIMQYDSTGAKVAAVIVANQLADVEYDGADLVLLDALPVASLPAGSVLYMAKNTAPTGFLKANGAAVSRTTYAALFAAIGTTFGAGDGATTFNLPDLRGEFIRGWDDSRGVDSGRAFGSAQADDFKAHSHNFNQYAMSSIDNTGGSQIVGADSGGSSLGWSSGAISSTGGTETRPRNVALLGCIKY